MWVIVLAGHSIASSNLYYEAHARNIKLACLVNLGAAGVPSICDKVIEVESWEESHCTSAINKANLKDIIAVLPISEAQTPLAENLEKQILAKDKQISPLGDSKLKHRLREMANSPRHFPAWDIKRIEDFEVIVETYHQKYGDVVVKPVHGFSGIGVNFIHSTSEIPAAKDNLMTSIGTINERVHGLTSEEAKIATQNFLVEERIESPEFAIDGVISNGRLLYAQICEKGDRSIPFQEDQRYFTPPNLPYKISTSAHEFASHLALIYPNLTSAFHIEFKYKGNDAKILDIAFRVGGSGLSDLIHFQSTGVSLFGVWLDAILGRSPDLTRKHIQKPTMLYLGQTRDGGKLTKIPYSTEISLPETTELVFEKHFFERGQTLSPFPKYSGHPNAALFVFPPGEQGILTMERAFQTCQNVLNPIFERRTENETNHID